MTETLITRGPFLAYCLTLSDRVWFVADLSGKKVCQAVSEVAALEIAEALTEYAERRQEMSR